MAYLGSAALSTLYGRLYITKGSTFHTNLAVFLLHLPLIKLSRFANLETLPFPPLTLGHTMPVIPYTSGRFSLPSGTGVGPVRPSRGWFGCLGSAGALASDSLKVRGRWFACQQSGPSALLIVWHGAHAAHAAHAVTEPRTRSHAQIP